MERVLPQGMGDSGMSRLRFWLVIKGTIIGGWLYMMAMAPLIHRATPYVTRILRALRLG
jgi:hypothetical protein